MLNCKIQYLILIFETLISLSIEDGQHVTHLVMKAETKPQGSGSDRYVVTTLENQLYFCF